ncbi:DUF6379 domain-containing protein [Arthrobacter sp. D1-29]
MLQTALREDALTATPKGFELRIGLPWIRSMPLSSVLELMVEIDGVPLEASELAVVLDARDVPADSLQGVSGWWFVQDRLVVSCRRKLQDGVHAVAVGFQLLVPYLQARPGTPLVLPFRLEAGLVLDHAPVPSVSRDVA